MDYRTIEIQTDLPTKHILELQKSTENIKETPKGLLQTPKISQTNSSKPSLHRRNKPSTTTTLTTKQTRKSTSEKSLPSIKININCANPPSKEKKDLPTTDKQTKKKII